MTVFGRERDVVVAAKCHGQHRRAVITTCGAGEKCWLLRTLGGLSQEGGKWRAICRVCGALRLGSCFPDTVNGQLAITIFLCQITFGLRGMLLHFVGAMAEAAPYACEMGFRTIRSAAFPGSAENSWHGLSG